MWQIRSEKCLALLLLLLRRKLWAMMAALKTDLPAHLGSLQSLKLAELKWVQLLTRIHLLGHHHLPWHLDNLRLSSVLEGSNGVD